MFQLPYEAFGPLMKGLKRRLRSQRPSHKGIWKTVVHMFPGPSSHWTTGVSPIGSLHPRKHLNNGCLGDVFFTFIYIGPQPIFRNTNLLSVSGARVPFKQIPPFFHEKTHGIFMWDPTARDSNGTVGPWPRRCDLDQARRGPHGVSQGRSTPCIGDKLIQPLIGNPYNGAL